MHNEDRHLNFYDREFLNQHCQSILSFYDPIVDDPGGGFYQNYCDNGDVFDPGFRQLVSSTRLVVNKAAMTMKHDRIKPLLARLDSAVKKRQTQLAE